MRKCKKEWAAEIRQPNTLQIICPSDIPRESLFLVAFPETAHLEHAED